MIKRFAQCLREYKWTALVSPVCMVGEVAMEVTIPLVMADLYDYGIAARCAKRARRSFTARQQSSWSPQASTS